MLDKILYAVIVTAVSFSTSLSAQEISVTRYRGGKTCAMSFTFDDGLKDSYTTAAPELEKRGWRGTFWVCGARISGEVNQTKHYMTWADVRDLHMRGHEISNHGWEHRNLTKISLREAADEIEKNDSAIFSHIGVRPVSFCYPHNAKNSEIIALASKGRVGTRVFQHAFGERSADDILNRTLSSSIRDSSWIVWMTHGLIRGYDHFTDQSRFTGFLDRVKDVESDIWVATFKDVAAYVTERDEVRLHIDRRRHRIRVTPSLNLDQDLYGLPLTLCVITTSRIKARQDGKILPVTYGEGNACFDFNPYGGVIVVSEGK